MTFQNLQKIVIKGNLEEGYEGAGLNMLTLQRESVSKTTDWTDLMLQMMLEQSDQ